MPPQDDIYPFEINEEDGETVTFPEEFNVVVNLKTENIAHLTISITPNVPYRELTTHPFDVTIKEGSKIRNECTEYGQLFREEHLQSIEGGLPEEFTINLAETPEDFENADWITFSTDIEIGNVTLATIGVLLYGTNFAAPAGCFLKPNNEEIDTEQFPNAPHSFNEVKQYISNYFNPEPDSTSYAEEPPV